MTRIYARLGGALAIVVAVSIVTAGPTFTTPLRTASPYGKPLEDYDSFYKQAKGMMYDPTVQKAFQFSSSDGQRYGGSAFGNACPVDQEH